MTEVLGDIPLGYTLERLMKKNNEQFYIPKIETILWWLYRSIVVYLSYDDAFKYHRLSFSGRGCRRRSSGISIASCTRRVVRKTIPSNRVSLGRTTGCLLEASAKAGFWVCFILLRSERTFLRVGWKQCSMNICKDFKGLLAGRCGWDTKCQDWSIDWWLGHRRWVCLMRCTSSWPQAGREARGWRFWWWTGRNGTKYSRYMALFSCVVPPASPSLQFGRIIAHTYRQKNRWIRWRCSWWCKWWRYKLPNRLFW